MFLDFEKILKFSHELNLVNCFAHFQLAFKTFLTSNRSLRINLHEVFDVSQLQKLLLFSLSQLDERQFRFKD